MLCYLTIGAENSRPMLVVCVGTSLLFIDVPLHNTSVICATN